MKNNSRPLGLLARLLLAGLIACLAGIAPAAADPGQPRNPSSADDENARAAGGEADEEDRARRGFVIGLEAGGGLLWNDRHMDRPGEALAGLTVGYDLGALRLEAEMLGRVSEEGRQGPDHAGFGRGFGRGHFGRGHRGIGGLDALFGGLGAGIGGLETETGQLFLNLYYDFETGSRVTPWVGVGGGWATTEVEYDIVAPGLFWLLAAEEIGFPGLAFASQGFEFEGTDSVPGVQVLMGADVRLTDRLSLGVKVRWSRFGRATFEGPESGFADFRALFESDFASDPGEEPDFDELAGILDRAIGGLFVGAAHPFSIDLSGVAATLRVSYRF